MLPFLLTALLLATPDEPPAARPVPELPRSPKVDGVLGDFRGGVPLTARPLEGASATVIARVGAFRDTLYVAVEVQDEAVTDRDRVTLALHFPEAGVTAGGTVLRFGPAGKLEPRPEDGVSPAALAMVDAAVHRGKKGMTLEVAVPGPCPSPLPGPGCAGAGAVPLLRGRRRRRRAGGEGNLHLRHRGAPARAAGALASVPAGAPASPAAGGADGGGASGRLGGLQRPGGSEVGARRPAAQRAVAPGPGVGHPGRPGGGPGLRPLPACSSRTARRCWRS